MDMNPSHLKCLEIYGNFHKSIVNDSTEASRIIDKLEYIEK